MFAARSVFHAVQTFHHFSQYALLSGRANRERLRGRGIDLLECLVYYFYVNHDNDPRLFIFWVYLLFILTDTHTCTEINTHIFYDTRFLPWLRWAKPSIDNITKQSNAEQEQEQEEEVEGEWDGYARKKHAGIALENAINLEKQGRSSVKSFQVKLNNDDTKHFSSNRCVFSLCVCVCKRCRWSARLNVDDDELTQCQKTFGSARAKSSWWVGETDRSKSKCSSRQCKQNLWCWRKMCGIKRAPQHRPTRWTKK